MDAKQIRIQSLYTDLDYRCVRFNIVLACACLFTVFSYYLSTKTGTDWFSRSGAVMCLAAAAVTFRLVGTFQSALAAALKEGLASVSREIEVSLDPPRLYQTTTYASYVTGIAGTVIWGYGDQILRLVSVLRGA